MARDEYFRVAKIVGTHALRGDLKIAVTTDFAESRFKVGNELKLKLKNKQILDVVVKKFQYYKNGALLGLDGYTNINDVEHFKGGELYIHESYRTKLPDNEFYQSDLQECKCISTDGEELGILKEIIDTGAHDVFVIKKDGVKDLLVPFNEHFVVDVDIENKKIVIQMMEGL